LGGGRGCEGYTHPLPPLPQTRSVCSTALVYACELWGADRAGVCVCLFVCGCGVKEHCVCPCDGTAPECKTINSGLLVHGCMGSRSV